MKPLYFLLATCLVFTMGCSKKETLEQQNTTQNVEQNHLKVAQVSNSSSFTLQYIGNGQWSGLWGPITLTFSGTTPEELASGLLPALFLVGTVGPGIQTGTVSGDQSSINGGYVEYIVGKPSTLNLQVQGVEIINAGYFTSNGVFVTDTTYTFTIHEITIATVGDFSVVRLPFKILKINGNLVLVHPDFINSTNGVPN
ncbi:MAG: hypothetical protein LWW85_00930 [Marinilabiliales bacterium]|nr:hypothetical protein [Marinilabiliales bacterium]